jgi:hypothetical protein
MKRNIRNLLLAQLAVLIALTSFAKSTQGDHLLNKKMIISDSTLNLSSLTNSEVSAADKSGPNQLRFDATYGGNYFEIIWNTVSAAGCDHFEIERSLDGIRFEKRGEVKGMVPCTRKDNFFFKDNIRPSTARKNDFYYRLKQVDANGQFSYSKQLIARTFTTKSVAALSITPDPDMNDILVNAQLKERSYVVIKLSDVNGNEVMRKSSFGDNGFNTFKMDETSKLKAGTYSLEVIVNSNERMTMKLIKS